MLLALHPGRWKQAGQLCPEQLSVGKLNNVRAALEVCRRARTVLSANGIMVGVPDDGYMANLEWVHTLVIGEALTGQNAFC